MPLSTGALGVLDELRGLSDGGLALRGPGGGELGKSTVAKALGKADAGATAHGSGRA